MWHPRAHVEPGTRIRAANKGWRGSTGGNGPLTRGHFSFYPDGSIINHIKPTYKVDGVAKAADISGQRFGRLVAIAATDRRSAGNVVWHCRCDCGSDAFSIVPHLREGRRVSCGCAKAAGTQIIKRKPIHGHYVNDSPTATYRVWSGMWTRCTNQNDPGFKRYGGRGITVCERWGSFQNFLADMGERPDGLSIDRIDVNGPYAPENCRWATTKEQMRNRRNNTIISVDGKREVLADIADRTGFHRSTITSRIRKQGMAPEQATTASRATKSEAALLGNSARWGVKP